MSIFFCKKSFFIKEKRVIIGHLLIAGLLFWETGWQVRHSSAAGLFQMRWFPLGWN